MNIIFPTIGLCSGYFYFKSSDNFMPNLNRVVTTGTGYNGILCHTQTIVWLMINLPFIANSFTCYTSAPFKKHFFTNIPLAILAIGNLIAAIAFFFVHSKFPSNFSFVYIPNSDTGVVLLLMSVSLIICYLLVQMFKKCYKI